MDPGSDNRALITVGALLVLIFAACAFIIKWFWFDKRYSGGQFVRREIYRDFQPGDRRRATEEVEYIDDARRVDSSGESGCGPDPSMCPRESQVTAPPVVTSPGDTTACGKS
jgi:hypothetical protein